MAVPKKKTSHLKRGKRENNKIKKIFKKFFVAVNISKSVSSLKSKSFVLK